MSDEPIICPDCGSKNVVQTPDGRLQCLDCNFKWKEETIRKRVDDFEFGEFNDEENVDYKDNEWEEDDGAFLDDEEFF